MTDRPKLRALAERLGILASYRDVEGKEHATSDATCVALIAAMGHDASSEAAAARGLAAIARADARRLLEPTRVVRQSDPAALAVRLRFARGHARPIRYRATLTEECGREHHAEGWVTPMPIAPASIVPAVDSTRRDGPRIEATIALPLAERPDPGRYARRARGGARVAPEVSEPPALAAPLLPPLGYHTLRVEIEEGARAGAARTGGARDVDSAGRSAREDGRTRFAEQTLIVVPDSCPAPAERLGGHRAFGVCANLYAVRSERNWGVGDATDLGALLAWCGEEGGAFVGVNPLHALRNRGWEIGPYYPVSRLFRNALYIDIESIPELAESGEARALIAAPEFADELARTRAAERVDYDRVARLKRAALEALHATFVARHRGRRTPRGRAYAAYVRAHSGDAHSEALGQTHGGEARAGDSRADAIAAATDTGARSNPLLDFATFLALEEHFERGGPRRAPILGGWRAWRAAYRDPRSARVRAFRQAHADAIDFHVYVQFELDRQLAVAAETARGAGLRIGLYQDLAIGTAPGGADAWMFPGLFVNGASVGAPPDPLGPEGQNWGLPPVDPERLADDGFRYWIQLVRGALEHSGALRIDHVMGLLRLFWIPAGRPASEGAYIRYPADALFGILALEGTRASALIVGEDLGTVPDGFPDLLAHWGVLSSRVLTFERESDGSFRAAARYSDRALVTANTHDLPTLAGFWTGRDIALRRALGLIASDDDARGAERARDGERRALLARLADEGIAPRDAAPPSASHLAAAVHAFLCRTPAPLVGLSLDDITGEIDPMNVPGTSLDQYPSWSRRSRIAIESFATDETVRRALAGARERALR